MLKDSVNDQQTAGEISNMQFYLESGSHKVEIAYESWAPSEEFSSIPSTGRVNIYRITFEGSSAGGATSCRNCPSGYVSSGSLSSCTICLAGTEANIECKTVYE